MDEQQTVPGEESGSTAVDQPLAPDEEMAELEKLLAQEPDDFQARCRLGELYFSKGRLDDALGEVKKAIEMAEGLRAEMNRSLAMYYSNLGTIYATKGMMEEAEAEFKRALEVHANDVLALFNLGRVYTDRKQFFEAKDYYERLFEDQHRLGGPQADATAGLGLAQTEDAHLGQLAPEASVEAALLLELAQLIDRHAPLAEGADALLQRLLVRVHPEVHGLPFPAPLNDPWEGRGCVRR